MASRSQVDSFFLPSGMWVSGAPRQSKSHIRLPREESSIPLRALYDVPEAMALLNLSRTQIYELIRTRRLMTVTQGRRRLVPADSISEYVQLLLREAGGDDGRAA